MAQVTSTDLTEGRHQSHQLDDRLSSKRHCFVGILIAAIALIIAELVT